MVELKLLYDYAVWANARVLAAAERLTPEQRHKTLGHSFGSIHETMVHVLSSEDLWLRRWQGESPKERTITPLTCPNLTALRAQWRDVEASMRAFLDGVSASDWEQVVRYKTLEGDPMSYPLWQLYLQVINHGTHHRAEAASMLTDLGEPPKPLDLVFYAGEIATR